MKKSMPDVICAAVLLIFLTTVAVQVPANSESIQSISDFSSGSRIPDGNLAAGEEPAQVKA